MSEWVDQITASFEKHYKIYCLIIALLAAINLFFYLGKDPVMDWDEARHGVTAYEMLQNHDYIKLTYMGETDYYNLKPPLGMWLIGLAYQIFGYNAFALRFFSALSAFLLILFAVFLARRLFNPSAAILTGLILATTFAVLYDHAGRTGDFDSILALLIIIGVISLYKMKDDIRYFYLVGLCLSLAFLLKSFASFQLIAITVVYLIIIRKLIKIKIRDYLLFLIILVIPVSLWAILRFNSDGSVFLQKMISTDLLQRGTTVIDQHKHDIFFYVYNMIAGSFPWILLLFIIPFYKRKYFITNEKKKFSQWMDLQDFKRDPLLLIWFALLFLIFSLSQTKCHWYVKPLYPIVAILIGWLLSSVIKPSFPKKKFFMIFFISLFVVSEVLMVGIMFVKKQDAGGFDHQIFTQLTTNSYPKNASIYATNWSQSQIFIAEVLKGLKPYSLSDTLEFIKRAKPNDLVLISNDTTNQSFIKQYQLKIIGENKIWVLAQKKN
ncbi:MAG TPA: glycosyltransferase family 39 protein [Bacillota bacterium]|nr:glycosyltransferase family 39 protein [Bacillota bacterium]